MSNTNELFILIRKGDPESVWATYDQSQAIAEAQSAFLTWFWDFERHRLDKGDIILASEVDTDWRLVKVFLGDGESYCDEVDVVPLPFQQWIDETCAEYQAERERETHRENDPEWAEFVRLRRKFQQ